MTDIHNIKRSAIRFTPDNNTIAYIKKINHSSPGQLDAIGLVNSEAKKGFGCILLKNTAPVKDELCLVKVGELSARQARVVYVEKLGADCVHLGFEYI